MVLMGQSTPNYRDGLVSGLSKTVKEEQAEIVRAAKEQDRLRQLEVQARREAKLAKARQEQREIDTAAAAAGIDASEIRRIVDATYSDDDDGDADEAEGDRLWQAKSEEQSVEQEQSSSHALTVLHVKCGEVAQEVRLASRGACAPPRLIGATGPQEGEHQAWQTQEAAHRHDQLRQTFVLSGLLAGLPRCVENVMR